MLPNLWVSISHTVLFRKDWNYLFRAFWRAFFRFWLFFFNWHNRISSGEIQNFIYHLIKIFFYYFLSTISGIIGVNLIEFSWWDFKAILWGIRSPKLIDFSERWKILIEKIYQCNYFFFWANISFNKKWNKIQKQLETIWFINLICIVLLKDRLLNKRRLKIPLV